MCYFLTVAVPAQHAELIERTFQPDFQTLVTTNPQVAAALPVHYAARVVTTGFCSCELFSDPARPRAEQLTEQLQRKFKKRGWGQAKIQRAIEQAKQSQARFPDSAGGIREDVIERLQVLAESAGAVGVFAHWYGGSLESELLELKQFATCNLADLNRLAAQLPEDQLLLADSRRVV
jgi:hypothetical protein